MEMHLRDMNKLIINEAMYILVCSLRGYAVLLNKFKTISVNQYTIGLNAKG
jgi:hypothetical protein